MKRSFPALMLAAAALLTLPAAAQTQSPFDGAWKGQLVSKDSSQGILLYVFDDQGKTTGFVALLDDSQLQYELLNVVRSDEKLSFEYGDPYETGLLPRVKVELKPANGGLAGTWSDTRDHSGAVTLARDGSARSSDPVLGDSPGPAPAPRPEDALAGDWTGVMVSGESSTTADLVITVLEDGMWGLMTPDVEAAATNFELGHAVLVDGTLTCDYQDARGPEPVSVTLTLKLVDPRTLEGTFRDASGKSGTLKLTLTGRSPSAPGRVPGPV